MRHPLSILLLLTAALCFTIPAPAQPSAANPSKASAASSITPAQPGSRHANTTTSKTSAITSKDAASTIRKLMADQADAWNRGSLDDFMKGYWNNDSLVFIGQAGPTYGYQQALSNYKKHYDSPDKMGQLAFTLIKIDQLSPDYCFVIGKWALKRKAGDVGGTYTLLFRKISGTWVIVVDHTS